MATIEVTATQDSNADRKRAQSLASGRKLSRASHKAWSYPNGWDGGAVLMRVYTVTL